MRNSEGKVFENVSALVVREGDVFEFDVSIFDRGREKFLGDR